MTNKLSMRFNRAKDMYQKAGSLYLIIQVINFLIFRYRVFNKYRVYFQCGDYYLYEFTIEEENEVDFMPRVQDLTYKIVTSNEQADELVADGLDFPGGITKTRHRLDKGAVARCVFVGGDLAHIAWVATTEEAGNSFDVLPYKVDFSNKQAWGGGTWTDPKYRRRGLLDYSVYIRNKFLRETGVLNVRYAVETSNIASKGGSTKRGSNIYAKGRYLRILWWKSWKETPLEPTNTND